MAVFRSGLSPPESLPAGQSTRQTRRECRDVSKKAGLDADLPEIDERKIDRRNLPERTGPAEGPSDEDRELASQLKAFPLPRGLFGSPLASETGREVLHGDFERVEQPPEEEITFCVLSHEGHAERVRLMR